MSDRHQGAPSTAGWDPVIVAFASHYCAYAAADLAGVLRLQCSPNVRVIRMPCTGKVESIYIVRAFEKGADGVIVAGCLEGGCHHVEGNLRARRRVERVQALLGEIGIESERLGMYDLSSAQGTRFAEIVNEMNDRVAKLGPSPLRVARQRVEPRVVAVAATKGDPP
ncbi:MAG: hydrogenase iron-sulfur subunit [Polyangiaceae bacterium]|nr:hydrogenase iron-sulfur subunit [Polyangiaceae bacterium]